MNFECWGAGAWAAGTWAEGSWCPGDEPAPDAPQIFGSVPVQANYRRMLDLMREDEEIVIL